MWNNTENIKQNIATIFDNHAESMLNFNFIPITMNFYGLLLVFRGFGKILQSYGKIRLFFAYMFTQLYLQTMQMDLTEGKYFLAKILESLLIKLSTYKEFGRKYFSRILKNRFYIYLVTNFSVTMTLKEFDENKIITLSFKGLHGKNYGVELIINYMLLKLDQYYTVKEIIFPVIRELIKQQSISGFRFVVAGRLDRTERATYMLKKAKSMPLSTKHAKIDYADNNKILRYGMIGIKLWLKLLNALPTYYRIRYINQLRYNAGISLVNKKVESKSLIH